MSDQQVVNDPLFDFIDEILRGHFGPEYSSDTTTDRRHVEQLLTDDTRRRVEESRAAAVEWGRAEVAGDVMIASDRLVITSHGLVYAAGMRSPGGRQPLYYLATPLELFESMVERVDATSLRRGSVAAVDDRFGHELAFPWPLDTGLRHMLDAHHALHLDLAEHGEAVESADG